MNYTDSKKCKDFDRVLRCEQAAGFQMAVTS